MIRAAAATSALVTSVAVCVAAEQAPPGDVHDLLERATARVVQYFARAQSLMCLERVSLQALTSGFSAAGPARIVESELRLSWEPTEVDPMPKEARTLRQVLRVNGHPPRKNDHRNCTTPEQQSSETQPLSILLPEQRKDYVFTLGGTDTVDGRPARIVNYREHARATATSSLVDDNEECISFEVDGGMRGRLWIDVETHDVLRLDRALNGLVEIPLPRKAVRFGLDSYWTMERWDSSIRFKAVTFEDPTETLLLPTSSITLQITRGAGTPRLRTSTQYQSYRRFITGARVLPPPS